MCAKTIFPQISAVNNCEQQYEIILEKIRVTKRVRGSNYSPNQIKISHNTLIFIF